MSLQVWLPLNGNLVNQGTSSAKFTSVGTSWSYGAGKVTSKCMICPTTSSATNYVYTSSTFKYLTNFSVSVWVKLPTSAQSQNASYIATEGRADAGSFGWGLSGSTTFVQFRFGNSYASVSSLSAGSWYLLTMTVDDNSLCKYYVNGVYKGSFTPSSLPTYADDNGIGIGCFKYSAGVIYTWNGSINDFRLYNHCLSVKEIKNLAKGLMLHYTLSRPGDNLLRNSYAEKSWSSTSTGSLDSNYSQDIITPDANSYYTMSFYAKSNKNSTGNFITYLYNNDSGRQCDSVKGYLDGELKFTGSSGDGACTMPTYTEWHKYVIVRHFNSTATALTKQNVFRIYNAGSSGLTMYVKQAKIEIGNKVTPWIPNMTDVMSKNMPINTVSPSGYLVNTSAVNVGSASSGTQWMYATFTPIGGGNFQPRIHRVRFKVTVLAGSVSTVTVLFYNLSTSIGNTRIDAPIVNGYVDIFITPSSAIPNLLIYAGVAGATANNQIRIDDLLVYDQFNVSDNSGYGNNGSAINITTVYPDTPRYQASYPFNGSNTFIRLPKGTARPTDQVTVSFWMYKLGTEVRIPISCTEGGGWNFEPNANGFLFEVFTTSYKIAYSGVATSDLINGWHHIVGTYNGSSVKIYIDSVLKATTAATGTISYPNNYTFVGAEAGGDTTTPSSSYFDGRISDVRIYATALSADDVLELYHTSASIDKNGNMHCYELVEV